MTWKKLMIGLSNGKWVSILIRANNTRKSFLVANQRDQQFYFNVSKTVSQKHLGVILDFKLTFEEHLNNVVANVNNAVGLLSKLQNLLPRTMLITIYKTFIWPHLDYGDVLYDQAFNNSFKEKLESVQYNVFLALTGAISGASKEKICQELELESLRDRRCCKKLRLFYKVLKNKNPKFLFSLIPTRRLLYSTQNIHNIHLLNTKHNFFKDSVIYNWIDHNWMEQLRFSS